MNTDLTRLAAACYRSFSSRLLPSVALLALGLPAFAQAEAAVSPSAMSQLVQMLVEQKTLTPQQGELLLQAAAAERAADAAQVAAGAAATAEQGSEGAEAQPQKVAGRMNVRYVPQSVKTQMKEEIKQEVMAQAREENWAAPRSFPDWTRRFTPFGDLRLRFETIGFANDNDPALLNFNAINTGSPLNLATLSQKPAPTFNTNADRNRLRLRARIGTDINLGEDFFAGIRIATGSDNSPVSTNQTLGSDGFGAKYAIWLDRAFLRYEVPGLENQDLSIIASRFDNPFFSTDLIWDDDIGFDGIAVQYRRDDGSVRPFLTVGGFPVYNTSLNLSSDQSVKFSSDDKWLLGAQIGAEVDINDKLTLKAGIAYYDFINIEGQLSSQLGNPFLPGDTDSRRPSFSQKGNTYMELRDNAYVGDPQYAGYDLQYYGLASKFRELALTTRLDIKHFHPFHVSIDAEIVKNLGYDEGRINRFGPQNNPTANDPNKVDGGDLGWMVRLNLGDPVIEERWDWQAEVEVKLWFYRLANNVSVDARSAEDWVKLSQLILRCLYQRLR